MLMLVSALDGRWPAVRRTRPNVVWVSLRQIEMSPVLLPLTGAKRIGSNRVVRFRDAFGG